MSACKPICCCVSTAVAHLHVWQSGAVTPSHWKDARKLGCHDESTLILVIIVRVWAHVCVMLINSRLGDSVWQQSRQHGQTTLPGKVIYAKIGGTVCIICFAWAGGVWVLWLDDWEALFVYYLGSRCRFTITHSFTKKKPFVTGCNVTFTHLVGTTYNWDRKWLSSWGLKVLRNSPYKARKSRSKDSIPVEHQQCPPQSCVVEQQWHLWWEKR